MAEEKIDIKNPFIKNARVIVHTVDSGKTKRLALATGRLDFTKNHQSSEEAAFEEDVRKVLNRELEGKLPENTRVDIGVYRILNFPANELRVEIYAADPKDSSVSNMEKAFAALVPAMKAVLKEVKDPPILGPEGKHAAHVRTLSEERGRFRP